MRRLRWWLLHLLDRQRLEREMTEELAFHVAARSADLEREGLDPAAAARRARIELGMVEWHKDEIRRTRSIPFVETLVADLRYGARTLWRDRGFTATALIVLSLAIAANLLLFVFVRAYGFGGGAGVPRGAWVDVVAGDAEGRTLPLFTRQEAARVSAAAAGTIVDTFLDIELRDAVAETGRASYGRAVSAAYWRALAMRPDQGRVFTDDEDEPTPEPHPLVLTQTGCRRLLASDAAALGAHLTLGGRPYVVVGVVPDAAKGFNSLVPQYFVPVGALPVEAAGREPQRFAIGGVLAPARVRSADAALGLAIPALRELAPAGSARITGLRAVRRRGLLPAQESAELAGAISVVAIAFLLVLLVACANLANLGLSRAVVRQREIAIRRSLGAGRWRVVRQLLTESLLLALAAGGIAVAMASAGVRALQAFVFGLVADAGLDVSPIAADGWIVFWGIALSLGAGFAFGLVPALDVTAGDLGVAAKRDARSFGRTHVERLRRALIVGQVAVSMVLLVVASLLIVSARRAGSLALGYDARRVFDAGMWSPNAAFAARVAADPAVEAVSAVSRLPLTGVSARVVIHLEGGSEARSGVRLVDERFFAALPLPIELGRGFERSEAATAAWVAVVSKETARRFWPGESPLGKPLEILDDPAESPRGVAPGRYVVIGVATDVVGGFFISGAEASAIYLPSALGAAGVDNLLVRARPGAETTLGERLRRLCREADAATVCEPAPLIHYLTLQRGPFEVAGAVGGALGLAAALISGLGLYGVVGFQVHQRRREFGVRAALGASRAGIVRLALRAAARAVGLGVALGLPPCIAVSALIRAYAPAVRSFDPSIYVGVPLVLGTLALAGALVPAWGAARIDPGLALREDAA